MNLFLDTPSSLTVPPLLRHPRPRLASAFFPSGFVLAYVFCLLSDLLRRATAKPKLEAGRKRKP